ncbi:DUF4365 domain-containing protein [Pedobacter kyonggii]|uniref:DUF4365 domain-containing protein n=1 Tax=Pedobacter kyonggii TaxID=1926871 RepID=A0A4Q9HGF2_9SPHI|nr:DUF4365 domain-containing protein [Pedobacter kyonggii]TBO44313.1 DUF4365 domain-containing protein [Pedobacter kyonggii]
MPKQNFDTQLTGQRAFTEAQKAIQDAGHFLQPVDGSIDDSIDGYIRLRKKVTVTKNTKKGSIKGDIGVETGNLIGIQVKGVSSIPASGSNSYYITVADKDKFGVNFSKKEKLDRHKKVWQNFIGPVILIFVDLDTKKCWWADAQNPSVYSTAGYSMLIDKKNILDFQAFKKIKKLGREKFVSNDVPHIDTVNTDFPTLRLTDFKQSAKDLYSNLQGIGKEPYSLIYNPLIGKIRYSLSGWKHITRLNRRKMRIFNSLMLLGVSYRICSEVETFTKVKKGVIRESKRFIKKVDFLTLRAEVHFNYRQSSIVQVVLRRVKTFDKQHPTIHVQDQVFFHSVYEPYRKE